MKQNQLSKPQLKAMNVYVKLMRATNQTTKDIHRHLQKDGLTHSQFAVLEALHHLGSLCLGELSQKILKSNANITTVVDSLEKKGLVIRDRTTIDRRRINLTLTTDGGELIARVFSEHAEIVEREFGVLSAEEQDQLGVLLKKLGLGR